MALHLCHVQSFLQICSVHWDHWREPKGKRTRTEIQRQKVAAEHGSPRNVPLYNAEHILLNLHFDIWADFNLVVGIKRHPTQVGGKRHPTQSVFSGVLSPPPKAWLQQVQLQKLEEGSLLQIVPGMRVASEETHLWPGKSRSVSEKKWWA